MKKVTFIVLGVIVGVGLFYAYKMARDQGWLGSCCGGGTADPWTQYTPPADTAAADTPPADTPPADTPAS